MPIFERESDRERERRALDAVARATRLEWAASERLAWLDAVLYDDRGIVVAWVEVKGVTRSSGEQVYAMMNRSKLDTYRLVPEPRTPLFLAWAFADRVGGAWASEYARAAIERPFMRADRDLPREPILFAPVTSLTHWYDYA